MSAKGTATFFFILIFMCSSLILRNIVINYSKILPNCTKTILQKKSCLTALFWQSIVLFTLQQALPDKPSSSAS